MNNALHKAAASVGAVECDNCSWTGTAAEDCPGGIADIEDIWDRLEPGTECPAGVCPKCGGLAYLIYSPCQRHEDAVREFATWLISPDLSPDTLKAMKEIADGALENLKPAKGATAP